MSTMAGFYIEKARKLLRTARDLVKDGYANAAGRDAYLAAFNAAQALIVDVTGRPAKTHNGVHTQFAQLAMHEPRVDGGLKRFLPEAYNLKTVADYELAHFIRRSLGCDSKDGDEAVGLA